MDSCSCNIILDQKVVRNLFVDCSVDGVLRAPLSPGCPGVHNVSVMLLFDMDFLAFSFTEFSKIMLVIISLLLVSSFPVLPMS